MKKGLSSTKLTTKIALMNAVIVLLAVALGAFFSVRSLTSNITDLLHKDALSTASFVNAEIETILLPKTALVETLATTLAVQSFSTITLSIQHLPSWNQTPTLPGFTWSMLWIRHP